MNSGQLCFSGQAQVAQKSWIIKNISLQIKISGQTLFSGQTQVAQKSWMIKNTWIQWKFSGQLCFSGQAQVDQISCLIKIYIQYSQLRANSVFQGKRKLLKNPEPWKNFQYSVFSVYSLRGNPIFTLGLSFTVYSLGGGIWASVVCNLDQSRDWL